MIRYGRNAISSVDDRLAACVAAVSDNAESISARASATLAWIIADSAWPALPSSCADR